MIKKTILLFLFGIVANGLLARPFEIKITGNLNATKTDYCDFQGAYFELLISGDTELEHNGPLLSNDPFSAYYEDLNVSLLINGRPSTALEINHETLVDFFVTNCNWTASNSSCSGVDNMRNSAISDRTLYMEGDELATFSTIQIFLPGPDYFSQTGKITNLNFLETFAEDPSGIRVTMKVQCADVSFDELYDFSYVSVDETFVVTLPSQDLPSFSIKNLVALTILILAFSLYGLIGLKLS